MIIVALAVGLLGLVLSMVLRRNTERATAWEQAEGIVDERFVYLSVPGFSLLLVGFGALGLVMPLSSTFLGKVLAFLCGAIALAGVALSGWGLFAQRIPTWLLPKWKRREDPDA